MFVEASAKSGENVEEAFERATRDILEKVRRGVFDDDRVSSCSSVRVSVFSKPPKWSRSPVQSSLRCPVVERVKREYRRTAA